MSTCKNRDMDYVLSEHTFSSGVDHHCFLAGPTTETDAPNSTDNFRRLVKNCNNIDTRYRFMHTCISRSPH
jgi:hypothetical protein